MDEILLANFMVFHDLAREEDYDLWIGDESWELDYYLHENPEQKTAAYAWFTDFVGWLPMADGGEREAFLTADYNAEMIEHIARYPRVRDRAIFVGDPDDIVAASLRPGPATDPRLDRAALRLRRLHHRLRPTPARETANALGYRADERVCIVTVGGSGVGGHLLRRVIAAFPEAKDRVPDLRMIVVAGPRIDPASLPTHDGPGDPPLRPRTVPPSRRVRPRDRPGRPDHRHGADRQPQAIPLLPARSPLRAELPRPITGSTATAPAGAWTTTPQDLPTSPRRSPVRSAATSTTARSPPTAPPAPRPCSPASSSKKYSQWHLQVCDRGW